MTVTYDQQVQFTPKDTMDPGTEAKRTRGFEIDGELQGIAAVLNIKYDSEDLAQLPGDETSDVTLTTPAVVNELIGIALGSGAANPLVIGDGTVEDSTVTLYSNGAVGTGTSTLEFQVGPEGAQEVISDIQGYQDLFENQLVARSSVLRGSRPFYTLTENKLDPYPITMTVDAALVANGGFTTNTGIVSYGTVSIRAVDGDENQQTYGMRLSSPYQAGKAILQVGPTVGYTGGAEVRLNSQLNDDPDNQWQTVIREDGNMVLPGGLILQSRDGDAGISAPSGIAWRNIDWSTGLDGGYIAYAVSGQGADSTLSFQPGSLTELDGSGAVQFVTRATAGTKVIWRFTSEGTLTRDGIVVLPIP